MKKILVTGASGFIGRHLVPFLAKSGFGVIAATRDHTLRFERPNIDVATFPKNVAKWNEILANVDAVVHLAAIAHQEAADSEHSRVSLALATEAAEAAARHRVGHFVLVSSILAQCSASASGMLSEHTAELPSSAYGKAKLAAEEAVKSSGVPFTILRPVLIGGPGAKGNFAVLDRIVRLPVPLPFAGLESRRSILSIANFNSAVRAVLFNQRAIGETFVVADPVPLTVAQIIGRARQRVGRSELLFRVHPKIIEVAMTAVGRKSTWDKLSLPLIVDPSKLLSIGWRAEGSPPRA